MFKLPLNNIGEGEKFFELKKEIELALSNKYILWDGWTPREMFNYFWCNLDKYDYIRGESDGNKMKYLIVASTHFDPYDEKSPKYWGSTIYISPEYFGAGKSLLAAAFLDYSTIDNIYENEITIYTMRPIKLSLRLFKDFGAEYVSERQYKIKFGLKYKDIYEKIINA